jgi:S-adenosylmethionine:tRNA ribosyltransferase-isomerase
MIAVEPCRPPAGSLDHEPLPLGFDLDERHIATEPAEERGLRRDQVRLLVSAADDPPEHATFTDLPDFLEPGDLVVVNTSATIPAAIDADLGDDRDHRRIVVHVSTELPGRLWIVEPRALLPNGSSEPLTLPPSPTSAILGGGTELSLLRPMPGSRRLWLASVDDDVDLLSVLGRDGRPIRYRYIERDWPLEHYQTIFATRPGSAEMPSAARPFTPQIVTALVRRGVGLVTIELRTGVSSLEGHELPYPERYDVPAATAAAINTTHRLGGHVIAVGTTVVRALETVVDRSGEVHPGDGWSDVVVTPAGGVRAVDGLVTGWHEPGASHLAMLEAIAGRAPLISAYDEAWRAGYRWHEFGDSHLVLPYAGGR